MVKKKEIKPLLVPNEEKKTRRKLGSLQGKATYKMNEDYKMTEEEFTGL